MATGTIFLLPESAVFPDGSTNNIAPALSRVKGSQTNAVHYLILGFDGAGAVVEQCYWKFCMPANYASGGTLKICCQTTTITAGNIVWQASLSAITAADVDTPQEHAFSTAATVTVANNATEAGRLIDGSITMNMDSAAAGDLIFIRLLRDPANGSDTHATDANFISGALEYTTA